MVDFIESPRFPEDISYGSGGGPGFKTHVFEGNTGIEFRTMTWSIARGKWDVSQGIRDKDDMDRIRAFFYDARGRAAGFRFKDWSDYELKNELIGVTDGTTTQYPIKKTYGVVNPYVRRIFKPVVGTIVVKANGVPVSGAVVDYSSGVVTLAAPLVAGLDLTVDGEFDVPVRFDTDEMKASHDGFLTESWSGIPLIEILNENQL